MWIKLVEVIEAYFLKFKPIKTCPRNYRLKSVDNLFCVSLIFFSTYKRKKKLTTK